MSELDIFLKDLDTQLNKKINIFDNNLLFEDKFLNRYNTGFITLNLSANTHKSNITVQSGGNSFDTFFELYDSQLVTSIIRTMKHYRLLFAIYFNAHLYKRPIFIKAITSHLTNKYHFSQPVQFILSNRVDAANWITSPNPFLNTLPHKTNFKFVIISIPLTHDFLIDHITYVISYLHHIIKSISLNGSALIFIQFIFHNKSFYKFIENIAQHFHSVTLHYCTFFANTTRYGYIYLANKLDKPNTSSLSSQSIADFISTVDHWILDETLIKQQLYYCRFLDKSLFTVLLNKYISRSVSSYL